MSSTPITPTGTNNSISTLTVGGLNVSNPGLGLTNAGSAASTDPSNPDDVSQYSAVVVSPGSNATLVSSHSITIAVADSTPPDGTALAVEASIDPSTGKPVSYNVVIGSGNNNIRVDGPANVQSTTGNDGITSRGGHDTITGGSGMDTIYGGGHSMITGGTTADSITAGLFDYSHDTIGAGERSTINLTNGDNSVYLSGADGVVHAGSGNDIIFGSFEGPSYDTIFGGGHTTIYAGIKDIIHSTGADTVVGHGGQSQIISAGNDADGNGQSISDETGSLSVSVDNKANDSIFGGVGANGVEHNVSVTIDQSSTSYDPTKNTLNADGSTTIHFSNGQTLDVKHVSLTFNDTKTTTTIS